jgi:hypothetical protein
MTDADDNETLWNVAITVVALIKATSAEEAIEKYARVLRDGGHEPYGKGDAFESERVD